MKHLTSQSYDIIYEELIKKQHILDSLNLLIFNVLLILVLLTVWLFKNRRIPYLHETGLAIIYGLIAGAVIKYGYKGGSSANHQLTARVQLNRDSKNYSADFFPTDLLLSLHGDSINYSTFSYKLANRVLYAKNPAVTGEDTELENKLTFDPEVFFNVLLPPIIFNAGYSLNRGNFFNNIGTISAFAFAGTVISTFVAGSIFFALTLIWPSMGFKFNDCLFFGATVSATDPVTVLAIFSDMGVDSSVYSLVFGESVLNDAIAMVLALTIDKYVGIGGANINFSSFINTIWRFFVVFVGSLVIGFGMGFVTAIMTKFTKIREFPLLETSLFFLMSYSTFLIAEVLHLSGIVAVLFAGIFQAHYTYYNLSKKSQLWTKQLYELMSFLVENFIFCYIGVSMFTFQNHKFHFGLIISAFIAIFISRMCNIYPLSFLLNLGRNRPIPLNTQHMLMFSGLRGAMAFALAIRNTSTPQRRAIYTTTSIIVIITVLFCGGLTTNVLSLLQIRVGSSDSPKQYPDENRDDNTDQQGAIRKKKSLNNGFVKQSPSHLNASEIVSSPTKYQKFKDSFTELTNRNSKTTISAENNDGFIDNNDDDDVLYNVVLDGTTDYRNKSVPDINNTNIVPDSHSHNFLVRTWGYLDYKFLKPLLTQTHPSLMVTLPKFWQPVARILTTAEQMRRNTEAQLINSHQNEDPYYGTNNTQNNNNKNTHTVINNEKKSSNLIVNSNIDVTNIPTSPYIIDDPPIINVTNIR